jgi:hypothetical protein
VNGLRQSRALPWILATVGFPIGGFLGHLVAGPAATVPAALISGLIAGACIGLAQALALGLRSEGLGLWVAATSIGLGIALAGVTAAIGQIETTTEAIGLGAVSGLAVGVAQAALLMRRRVANAWVWIVAAGIAWAVGWLITSSVGVALAPGWPVFGLAGAIVSQIITGVEIWRLGPSLGAPAPQA